MSWFIYIYSGQCSISRGNRILFFKRYHRRGVVGHYTWHMIHSNDVRLLFQTYTINYATHNKRFSLNHSIRIFILGWITFDTMVEREMKPTKKQVNKITWKLKCDELIFFHLMTKPSVTFNARQMSFYSCGERMRIMPRMYVKEKKTICFSNVIFHYQSINVSTIWWKFQSCQARVRFVHIVRQPK